MTDPHARRRMALALLVLTALLWSLGGLLIKSIRWNPMAVSGMRSLIAAAVIALVCRRMRFTWTFNQIGGAVAYAATVTLFVLANRMTTAANAILLQYTAPVWVALFAPRFLGERAGRRDWLTMGAVLGGMTLFFLDRLSPTGALGNVVAVGSGFCFGWMTLFFRRQKEGSAIESVFLGNLLAAAVGAPFMFNGPADGASWAALALLGAVQVALPYVLFSVAVRHVTALEAMIVPMIEPVLNPIWVLLALGEKPGPWAVAGGVVVLGAIAVRALSGRWSKD
jgi:drug/metabolite transporter (DMT)-like permease